MAVFYVVQHGEKEAHPGDPGLTGLGRRQAARTGRWLTRAGMRAVVSSPMLRARQTADLVAAAASVPVIEDVRLRERMNWDGTQPFTDFLADWAVCVRDRDFVPASGDSSRQAAERFRACLTDLAAATPGPAAVCTHGGITADLLRTLLGDQALPATLIDEGIPPCAITVLSDLAVVEIASVRHLGHQVCQ